VFAVSGQPSASNGTAEWMALSVNHIPFIPAEKISSGTLGRSRLPIAGSTDAYIGAVYAGTNITIDADGKINSSGITTPSELGLYSEIVLTQQEYDSIDSKDASTLYFIKE
jgi:hypothetical protein